MIYQFRRGIMKMNQVPPLAEFIKGIADPRIDRKKLYPLDELIIITILAFLSGAEGWEDIAEFAKCKEELLKKHLELKNGLPQHDVYGRVFRRLDPEQLGICFMEWVQAMRIPVEKEVFAVDGKTMRGSLDKFKCLKAAHIVSVFATENRLTLAQVKTDEKSNEITAIPEVLALIALKGAIVTIDAMGCQYKIADQIVEGGGDFLFSLKGNQETLHDDVAEYFKDVDFKHPDEDIKVEITHDVDHGRIERRSHAVSGNVGWLIDRHPAWKTIKSIGVIESWRDINGVESTEKRYIISSLPATDPKQFAAAARSHWGIENTLHNILDVAFKEDRIKIRCGNSPENLNTVRKIALALAKHDTTPKRSTRKKLKMMSWSSDYLDSLLCNPNANFFAA
jgi:predicted transposase YbfD/YdcC